MLLKVACPRCGTESFTFSVDAFGLLADESEQDICRNCGHPHPGYNPDALEFTRPPDD